MNDIAHRVALRHLQAVTTEEPVRVILADGGEITATDIERLLGVHGLDVRGVEVHAGATRNTVGWTGLGRDGHQVHDEVRARVDFDDGRAVVSAEIVITKEHGRVFID